MLYRHVDRDHVGGLTDKVLVYGSCRKVQIDGECRWVRKMFSPRDKRLDADWAEYSDAHGYVLAWALFTVEVFRRMRAVREGDPQCSTDT